MAAYGAEKVLDNTVRLSVVVANVKSIFVDYGYYPVCPDISKKSDNGSGGLSCKNEESTPRGTAKLTFSRRQSQHQY
jgi:hypothetical protein